MSVRKYSKLLISPRGPESCVWKGNRKVKDLKKSGKVSSIPCLLMVKCLWRMWLTSWMSLIVLERSVVVSNLPGHPFSQKNPWQSKNCIPNSAWISFPSPQVNATQTRRYFSSCSAHFTSTRCFRRCKKFCNSQVWDNLQPHQPLWQGKLHSALNLALGLSGILCRGVPKAV